MWFMVQGKSAPERKNNYPKFFNDNRSIKVGLMGGSFNPAHKGHLFVASTALKKLNLDEIWWLLTPRNPLKDPVELKSINDRSKQTKKIALHPKFRVLNLENYFQTSSTFNFLKLLLPRCPNMKIVWIMGADNLSQFHKWNSPHQIAKLIPFAVFSRPKYFYNSINSKGAKILGTKVSNNKLINLVNLKPPVWSFIDEGRYNISSTNLRTKENKNYFTLKT